jgi:hypothetical protein
MFVMNNVSLLKCARQIPPVPYIPVTPPLQVFDGCEPVGLLRVAGTVSEHKVVPEIHRVA